MDYQREVKALSEFETQEWFKPVAGKHEILVLREPEEIEKEFEKQDVQGNKVSEKTKQIRLRIKTNNQEYTWDIGRGQTRASVYGQLMLLGSVIGKLEGVSFHLNVVSDGKKNTYSIDEVLPLMNPNK